MKKIVLAFTSILILIVFSIGCKMQDKQPKIGVCLVAGSANRWAKEAVFMQDRAKEIGASIDARVVFANSPKTPKEECFELIDKGIDVLILRPKDDKLAKQVVEYAKQKNVKIISYNSLTAGEQVDLFIGYDYERIGQRMGQYITEMVPKGDYIILSGDPKDKYVSQFLRKGAMKYIQPLTPEINIILDSSIPNWNPNNAKKMVIEAIAKNNNKIDAILAPNDVIAGACTEALKELGIKKTVIITGMDGDLDAARRIVDGTQSCTIYMDLKTLAVSAVNEAYNIAKKQKVNVNASFENDSASPISANLITGQLVTQENLDRIFIKRGVFTKEQIYSRK